MISEFRFAHDTYESLSRNCIYYQFVLDSFNSEYLQKEHYHLVDARLTRDSGVRRIPLSRTVAPRPLQIQRQQPLRNLLVGQIARPTICCKDGFIQFLVRQFQPGGTGVVKICECALFLLCLTACPACPVVFCGVPGLWTSTNKQSLPCLRRPVPSPSPLRLLGRTARMVCRKHR
jgi:hypothetical protein